MTSTTVILGTGGTIAGTAADPNDAVGYRSAQRSVADLLATVPALAGQPIECEQVAQLDSKDMDHATWQRLARRAAHHLARPEVAGVAVTHGTDTLEESAWFLHRVLAPAKPLVLTAAMRPATALDADGPRNLLDAVTVARESGAHGVVVVLAGTVHAAADLRKVHPYRLDAFSSGDAGPLAQVEEGRLRRHREWPQGRALGLTLIGRDPSDWPGVVVWASHAGVDAAVAAATVDAWIAAGVRGIVVAGTGNGTLHQALDSPLRHAAQSGVTVWRASRCAQGAVVGQPDGAWPSAAALSPWQARVELMLRLLGGSA